jgi:hypothetical protein
MNERTSAAGRAPKTLVWTGEWSAASGHYTLRILTLDGNVLGTAHPLRHQSFEIVENTNSKLVLLDAGYNTAVRKFDKAGTLKDNYTFRYVRTD